MGAGFKLFFIKTPFTRLHQQRWPKHLRMTTKAQDYCSLFFCNTQIALGGN